jgi:hypothetical protein
MLCRPAKWLFIPLFCFPAFAISLTGCSERGAAPMAPGSEEIQTVQLAGKTPEKTPHNSTMKSWGTWELHCIDPTGDKPASIEAIPFRSGEAHIDVLGLISPPLCSNCMDIEVEEVAGEDWTVRVTLTNPTIQTAYDVMGVFPGSNCPEIVSPDSYTDLFDVDGYSDTHNPFKCFETGADKRMWGPGESHDQLFTFRRGQGEKFSDLIYVVAASWPESQAGVVALVNPEASGPLYTDTSMTTDFTVQVLDWQDDIEYVIINLEPVNGSAFAHMQSVGNGVYKLFAFAAWGLTAGTSADLTITAKSLGADYLTYNYLHVEIIDPPPPPVSFEIVTEPVTLDGPVSPTGELDLSVIGETAGQASTFMNVTSTDIYAWNLAFDSAELLVHLLNPSGSNPDFPIDPVSRIALPLPISPTSPDTFSILQTNEDTGIWDNSTNPTIPYRNTLQLTDLESLQVIDFSLTADNSETPELDAILRPVDVSSGVEWNKSGYALWVPDEGTYPTYYPYVVLVRYEAPYKTPSQEYDSLIGGVLEGSGDGKIQAEDANALAVYDGNGDGNIIAAVSEGGKTNEVEILSIDYTNNPAGEMTPVATISGLPGAPVDLAILPQTADGKIILCILTDSKTIELYTLDGVFLDSYLNPDAIPYAPIHMDADVENARLHIMMEGPTVSVIHYKGL